MLADRTSPGKVSISATLLLRLEREFLERACDELELDRRERVDSEEVVRERVSIVLSIGDERRRN